MTAPTVRSTAPVIWAVLGDKTGDNAQIAAIAEALQARFGWPVTIKRLSFKPRYRTGKLLFLASLYHVERRESDPLQPPWPDLALTVGLRPAMAALWLKKRSNGRTRVALVGRPKRGVEAYDLVIAPVQYRIPDAPNLVRLGLPLMSVDRQRLNAAAGAWQERFAALAKPVVAVLVGAATRPFRLDAAEVSGLIGEARRLAGPSGTLYATTSRRTPPDVVAALQAQLPAGAHLYQFGAAEPNPYLALLALADQFLVTGDSVSMMTEVAKLGRPLVIYDLPVRQATRAQRAGELADRLMASPGTGWLKRLATWLGLTSYPRDLTALHRYLVDAGLATRKGGELGILSNAPPAADQLEPVVTRLHELLARPGGAS